MCSSQTGDRPAGLRRQLLCSTIGLSPSAHPKKVNQRIPLNVNPPRTNEVPRKKIPVTGHIRRRAAADHIDTALIVGLVVCSQITEGYHITSIKLLPSSRQRSGDKEQQSRATSPLAAELVALVSTGTGQVRHEPHTF
jgi:hypothetical protein